MHAHFWTRAGAGAAVLAAALLVAPAPAAAQIETTLGGNGRTLLRGDGIRVDLLDLWAEALTPTTAEEVGLDPSTQGAVITRVGPDGAGDRGGLEAGDIVTAVDGQPIGPGHSLLSRVFELVPAEHVELALIRDGKPLTLELSLIPGVG